MRAHVGDWLVLRGRVVGCADQMGQIVAVHSADGSPPYDVRWPATGTRSVVVPGPDAQVMTPAEKARMDSERMRRVDAVQSAIRRHPLSAPGRVAP